MLNDINRISIDTANSPSKKMDSIRYRSLIQIRSRDLTRIHAIWIFLMLFMMLRNSD